MKLYPEDSTMTLLEYVILYDVTNVLQHFDCTIPREVDVVLYQHLE